MNAWAEQFASNPAACVCLTFVALVGVAAVIRAIRNEGRK